MKIKQVNHQEDCNWHFDKPGQVYSNKEIFPSNMCPILFHSVYPYFLGFHFGARYTYNEEGDCHVCCPALEGIDTLVRQRDNDGSYDPRILPERRNIIFAEVVKVHGHCPYHHKEGDRFIFPNGMKEHYMCPSGINNVFPFLKYDIPECIDTENLRCPDWKIPVILNVK